MAWIPVRNDLTPEEKEQFGFQKNFREVSSYETEIQYVAFSPDNPNGL
jgi:hypothetical protein